MVSNAMILATITHVSAQKDEPDRIAVKSSER